MGRTHINEEHAREISASDYLDSAATDRLAETLFNLSNLQPRTATNIGDVVTIEVTRRVDEDGSTYLYGRVLSDDESIAGTVGRLPAWQAPEAHIGSTFDCTVVSDSDANGEIELCLLESGRWQVVTAAFQQGCYLSAHVTEIARRKGDTREVGLVASAAGFRAFIPRSEINQHVSLESLVGRHVPVRIKKLVDPKPGKAGELVVTYLGAITAQQDRYIAQLSLVRRFRHGETLPFMDSQGEQPAVSISTMPGIEVTGIVRKTIEAGVLVDLNLELTGLVPRRELMRDASGAPVIPPDGSTVLVEVLNVDAQKRQILLSLRGPEERRFYSELNEGKIVTGTVTAVKPFGVFVSLGPVSGLLHASEFKEVDGHKETAPEVGSRLAVMVLTIQPESDGKRPRISLSRKAFSLGGFFDEYGN